MKKVNLFKNYRQKNKPSKPVEPVAPIKEYEGWEVVKYFDFDENDQIILNHSDFPVNFRLRISQDYDYEYNGTEVVLEKKTIIENKYYENAYKDYLKQLEKYKKNLKEYDDKLKKWEEEDKKRREKYSLDLKEGKLKQFEKLKKELKELGIG